MELILTVATSNVAGWFGLAGCVYYLMLNEIFSAILFFEIQLISFYKLLHLFCDYLKLWPLSLIHI